MKLVVVESPAKARTIEKYLGGDYHVLASYGHVRDLPSKDGSVQPENDFAMSWELGERAGKPLKEIKDALKGATALYLATDPDREGEAISWHLTELLKEKNALNGKHVYRVVFHEITREAIEAALKLVEVHGGEITTVTMAGHGATDVTRKALAMGATRGVIEPLLTLYGLAMAGELIAPKRRTMVQLRVGRSGLRDLPLVDDAEGSFYFKGEGDRTVWLSPHDEIDSDPCDAAPEEMDVAIAIDRFQSVVDWPVEAVERRWAGLRSFAPDRVPVYGFDPAADGFFWCAGQGGFGIQTAPAAAVLAASVLLGRASGPIDPEPFAPSRFRPLR